MAEYAKTSEITPLIGKAGDYACLESGVAEEPVKECKDETKSTWKDTTSRQKFLLLFVVIGHFTTFMCLSIPGPFMARVVTEKGGILLQSTIIVEITILMMAIGSIAFAKYQSLIGSKELLISGLVCFGACQTLFGALNYTRDITMFFAAATTIRTIQGIGLGAYVVAALTIICQTCPNQIGQVFGMVESAAGVGYLLGPMLGSMLYSITNGMLLPFVSSGGVLLIIMAIGAFAIKYDQEKPILQQGKFSAMDFIGNSKSFMVLGAAATVYGAYGTLSVTATIYLESRGFSVAEVGLVLLTDSLTYCLTSLVIGYVASIGKYSRRTILFLGLICMMASSLFFAPKQTKPWIYTGSAFLGIFGGFALITSFTELINIAAGDATELQSNFELHSTLSGAWNFIFGVGTFVYPLFTSALEKLMPFCMSMLMCFIVGYCFTIFIASMILISSRCRGGKRSHDEEKT